MEQLRPELLRLKDRHERDFCVGPTHEEVITDIARREVRSYRQLPINLYQIQTKFRDEIRPRFGVMRAREFIMKDAYSFDLDAAGLERSYLAMHDAYCRTFERLGLDYRVVDADSGAIGGSRSQEFHVIADYGEDAIAFSAGGFAANVEMVPCPPPSNLARPEPGEALRTVDTPGVHSIADLAGLLGIPAQRCIKTLLVEGEDGGLVALVLRGDHELNAVKAARIEGVLAPLTFARPERVKEVIGCNPGSLGPVGADLPVIADASAAALADFACGANRDGEHLAGVNWGRTRPSRPSPICATPWTAIRARTAPGRSPSAEASRSGTSSSSETSTAKRWAPSSSTMRDAPPAWSWAATGSGSPGSPPPPSSRTTTRRELSGRRRSRPSTPPCCR